MGSPTKGIKASEDDAFCILHKATIGPSRFVHGI
jgi:hypothetical protein